MTLECAGAGAASGNKKNSLLSYRPEIDGLRAVAVVPVILLHAGLGLFGGGFVGVDVFFVISGYLITSLILIELQTDSFSILAFYERRARRILPALFLVLGVSSVFAYYWMLPDELENFGQSLVATSLFSNNILLTLTSGYWALASEFKPLLHTWSLAVEEQYYIVFPLLLTVGWRFFRKHMLVAFVATAIISIVAAHWGAYNKPDAAFYLSPTRAWELLLGSFVAFYLNENSDLPIGPLPSQMLSGLGLFLILFSSVFYSQETPSPSLYTLVPTIGAVLVIVCARKGTLTYAFLTSRLIVGVGLVSYSAYLWHYPLFAFARIYSVEPPDSFITLGLCALTFLLAYLSWRFVEAPFRIKGKISRVMVFSFSVAFSGVLVISGYYLHKSHGVPSRMYVDSIALGDGMYIEYNERVFQIKRDFFSNSRLLNILVIGNSFARDFVNMTTENFDLENVEMVYRNDISGCLSFLKDGAHKALLDRADIIVFSSGELSQGCVQQDIQFARNEGKRLFYIGTKHFGYNLNWLARLDGDERRNRFNPLPPDVAQVEDDMSKLVPREYYISLLTPILKDGAVPITDEMGRLISPDRVHLTKYGAQYVGKKALVNSAYGEILARFSQSKLIVLASHD